MKECIDKLRNYFREKEMLDDEVVGASGEDYNFSWNVEDILAELEEMSEDPQYKTFKREFLKKHPEAEENLIYGFYQKFKKEN